MNHQILDKLKTIRLLALDVDGVMTDGGLYMDEDGRTVRRFHIQDGYGIKRLIAAGVDVAIVSMATSEEVRHRMNMLGIEECHLNPNGDKLNTLHGICDRKGITLDEVAFVGDDLPDIEVLEKVGFPACPVNAVPQVRNHALYVTSVAGGNGAVREICDLILSAQGE